MPKISGRSVERLPPFQSRVGMDVFQYPNVGKPILCSKVDVEFRKIEFWGEAIFGVESSWGMCGRRKSCRGRRQSWSRPMTCCWSIRVPVVECRQGMRRRTICRGSWFWLSNDCWGRVPLQLQGRPVVFYFARESPRAIDCGLNKNQSRTVVHLLAGHLN